MYWKYSVLRVSRAHRGVDMWVRNELRGWVKVRTSGLSLRFCFVLFCFHSNTAQISVLSVLSGVMQHFHVIVCTKINLITRTSRDTHWFLALYFPTLALKTPIVNHSMERWLCVFELDRRIEEDTKYEERNSHCSSDDTSQSVGRIFVVKYSGVSLININNQTVQQSFWHELLLRCFTPFV